MKKILLALVAVLATTAAFAGSAATANIPFEFRVGEKMMPAGTYTISQRLSGDYITLTKDDSSTSAGVLTTPLGRSKANQPSRLLFHRYGSTYFLSQVWLQNTEYGRKLKAGSAERETARLATQELASVGIQ